MSKVLTFRASDELGDWVEGYAVERGVSKQVLLENALNYFREDCENGVPDLKANLRAVRANEAKAEESRPTREDFARACADRSALFRGLEAPASVKVWGKK